ncbi:hypothetical protein FRB90_000774 [Tulasnella sp. 427]|nr:hypothetical protein FRB90_000774 [Tulasnella sp. 427]
MSHNTNSTQNVNPVGTTNALESSGPSATEKQHHPAADQSLLIGLRHTHVNHSKPCIARVVKHRTYPTALERLKNARKHEADFLDKMQNKIERRDDTVARRRQASELPAIASFSHKTLRGVSSAAEWALGRPSEWPEILAASIRRAAAVFTEDEKKKMVRYMADCPDDLPVSTLVQNYINGRNLGRSYNCWMRMIQVESHEFVKHVDRLRAGTANLAATSQTAAAVAEYGY